MAGKSSFLCCGILILIFTNYGECNKSASYPGEYPGMVAIYDVKIDVCYWLTKGSWPYWLGHRQIALRTSLIPRLFRNLNVTDPAKVKEACEDYQPVILDPDNNPRDYEFCWYVRYGMWKEGPLTTYEQNERHKMIEEYMYDNEKRISTWKKMRLCPNYLRMNCQVCKEVLEKNCYYARFGHWKGKAPSLDHQRKFFYTGAKRITIKELIKKCPKHFNKHCRKIYIPNCSGRN